MLHVEIFYRAFCPSYVAWPLSISSRCFLPAPLLCPPAVLLLSASFSLIQNHRALPSGGALRNFFAQGAFCSCCPLPPLPPHSQSPLLSPCAICLLPHLLLPLSHCPQTPFFTKETAAAAAMEKKLYACCVYLTCVMCVSQAVCKITCAIRPLRSSRLLPSQRSPPMRLQLPLRLRLPARSVRPEPRFLRRLSESDRLLPPFPRAPPAGTTIHPALLSPFACVRDRGDGSGGGGDSSSSGCNGS